MHRVGQKHNIVDCRECQLGTLLNCRPACVEEIEDAVVSSMLDWGKDILMPDMAEDLDTG